MKKLIFVLSILIFASCGDLDVNVGPGPIVTQSTDKGKFDSITFDGTEVERDTSPIKDLGPYENPFFIYGSDFGNFFQTMYTHGKFEDMIAFTSSKSIDQFGEDDILNFYKNELDFGFDIGKRPISHIVDGDTITLNYKANIMATNRIIRIYTITENDSCKVVLPNNLKDFPS